MKQEEIIENNKLIAEFMGIEERDMVFLFPVNLGKLFYSPNSCYNSKDEDCFELELAGLNYHNSWDWLMPVVEKIENLDFFCMINKWTSIYKGSLDSNRIVIATTEGNSKIMNTYIAVTKFIKWYNEKQSNNT